MLRGLDCEYPEGRVRGPNKVKRPKSLSVSSAKSSHPPPPPSPTDSRASSRRSSISTISTTPSGNYPPRRSGGRPRSGSDAIEYWGRPADSTSLGSSPYHGRNSAKRMSLPVLTDLPLRGEGRLLNYSYHLDLDEQRRQQQNIPGYGREEEEELSRMESTYMSTHAFSPMPQLQINRQGYHSTYLPQTPMQTLLLAGPTTAYHSEVSAFKYPPRRPHRNSMPSIPTGFTGYGQLPSPPPYRPQHQENLVMMQDRYNEGTFGAGGRMRTPYVNRPREEWDNQGASSSSRYSGGVEVERDDSQAGYLNA